MVRSILEHLQNLGYIDEVRDLGPDFEGLSDDIFRLVNQARPLTQRGQFDQLDFSAVLFANRPSQNGLRFGPSASRSWSGGGTWSLEPNTCV